MSEATNAAATTADATTAGDASSATAATAGAAPTEWTSGLAPDALGYVQNKGWRNPADAIESYRGLEKLRGVPQERLLALPEKADDPAWSDIYGKLGRPATPAEYKLPVPEGADAKFVGAAAETMHKLGLTRTQAVALAEWNNAQAGEYAKAQEAALNAQRTADADALRSTWGGAHDQNIQVAKNAAAQFGVKAEQVDALEKVLGFKGTMEFFHNIGAKIGEAEFVGGSDGGNGKLTPQQAQAEINALKGDSDWAKRYMNGGAEEKKQMERLLLAVQGQ